MTRLFLHWGPGGHARFEKSYFPKSLGVEWWDQPAPTADDPEAFTRLVDAAAKELLQRSSPRHLVAHSFGGQLALELSQRHPEAIASITLLASSRWPAQAFTRLAQFLEGLDDYQAQAPRLAKARKTVEASKGKDTGAVFALLQVLGERPEALVHYWGPQSLAVAQKYFKNAARDAPVDFTQMGTLLSSFLQTRWARFEKPAPSPYPGPVRLLVGSNDPLLDFEGERALWQREFPQLKSELVPEAGHFLHLEMAPELWVP